MQDLNQKTFLQRQEPFSKKQTIKNKNRVLFSPSFFSLPSQKTKPTLREEAEWRALLAMGLLIAFGMVMVITSIMGDYGLLETAKFQEKEQVLLEEMQLLKQKKLVLEEEINALHHNRAYLELLAHRELGLVQPNEKIYYLPPNLRLRSTFASQ